DLNTKSIGEGLSDSEQSYLRRDLEAVESGTPASSMQPDQKSYSIEERLGRDFAKEDQREQDQNQFYNEWLPQMRAGGIAEDVASDDELWSIYSTGSGDPEVIQMVERIESTTAS